MNNKIKTLFLFSMLTIGGISCKSSMLTPTPVDESLAKKKWNDASLAQLTAGFHLYVNKCASCHYLHNPKEFSVEKWEKEIPEMCKRAFLSEQEQDMILRYVLTKRENLLQHSAASK